MAQSYIVTNQYVRIQQTPASVGERVGARLIDVFICGIYVWILFQLAQLFENIISDGNIFNISFFLLILPLVFYSPIWEYFNRGQSPGKRILRMRVVKTDGTAPTLANSLMRWLLYLGEGPLFGCWGIVPMIVNRKHQRMGDLAAGTMVIKENSYEKVVISLDEFDYLTKGYKPVFTWAEDLSTEQAALIQRTLETENADRENRIAALAKKVKETFSLQALSTGKLNDEQFLRRVLRDYQYYAAIEI